MTIYAVDPQAKLRAFFMEKPTLSDWEIVAGQSVPYEGWKPSTGPLLAFKVRGGRLDERGGIYHASIQAAVYADKPNTAYERYGVFTLATDRTRGAYVRFFALETAGESLIDRAGWPFVLAYYRAMIIAQENIEEP